MKVINRFLSILLVMSILLCQGTVFAANSESYDAGYDAGYDYAYVYDGRLTSGSLVYNNSYKDSRAHRSIKSELGDDYDESDFKRGFIEGFNDGYYDSDDGTPTNYAAELGRMLGGIYGARDYQDGKKPDYKKALPGRDSLRKMYDLDRQKTAYINSFVTAFNEAFETAYEAAYEEAMFEPAKVTMEQGIADGEAAGFVIGAAYGAKDFYEGNDLYVHRDMPTASEIRSMYFLNKDSDEYEDGFISGFLRAYEEAYNQTYREANMLNAERKVTSEVVPISGALITTGDNRFAINVLAGTYYHDVNCFITTIYDAGTKMSGSLIKASDSYEIKIANSSGNVDDSKYIEIAFEYYGDKAQGGIYRKSGSQWLYVPTVVQDGMMSAKIKPSTLGSSGTTFSAFADTNVKIFRDARGHWASNEIDAYVRRGIISGYADNTFKPDNNITRAEFLTLLSKTYNWNTSYYSGNTTSFKDASTFGNYARVINYATSLKYIYGYDDGTFKPNNPISYLEVETIMRRLLPAWNFKWTTIAGNMQFDKKVLSNSIYSMNNKITRAEVVYMLYNITN